MVSKLLLYLSWIGSYKRNQFCLKSVFYSEIPGALTIDLRSNLMESRRKSFQCFVFYCFFVFFLAIMVPEVIQRFWRKVVIWQIWPHWTSFDHGRYWPKLMKITQNRVSHRPQPPTKFRYSSSHRRWDLMGGGGEWAPWPFGIVLMPTVIGLTD